MRISYFTVILLAVLLMCGCHRRDKRPTYYVDREMLRYCWFPDGSYWIYEEANTPGLRDSVYSSESTTRINQESELNYDYEGYGMTLTIRSKKRRQATLASPIGNQLETISELSEFYSDSIVQQVDHLLFWDSRGMDSLASYQPAVVFARYDSIMIQGVRFHQAIEIRIDPPQAADWTYEIVWVKDVGIVRRSLVNGEVWELVRYKVN